MRRKGHFMRRAVWLAVLLLCTGACDEGITHPQVSKSAPLLHGNAQALSCVVSARDNAQIRCFAAVCRNGDCDVEEVTWEGQTK